MATSGNNETEIIVKVKKLNQNYKEMQSKAGILTLKYLYQLQQEGFQKFKLSRKSTFVYIFIFTFFPVNVFSSHDSSSVCVNSYFI